MQFCYIIIYDYEDEDEWVNLSDFDDIDDY